MKARHENGTICDANDIEEGDDLKPGPWYCPTDGCPVQFKYHRVASYAVDEPDRVLRSGTFAHGDDRGHLESCSLNARAQKQKLLASHRQIVTEEGDKLLLRWGTAPKKDKPSGLPKVTKAGTTREEYAGIMSAASDVARIVDDSDGDDAILKRYWIVHQGTRYTWPQFCYGPAPEDLNRLGPSIAEAFTTKPWPRLVRAMISDAPDVTEDRVQVRFRAADKLANGSYVRGRLFAEPDSEGADALLALRGGDEVFILGDNWFMLKIGQPALAVELADQLSVQPRRSRVRSAA